MNFFDFDLARVAALFVFMKKMRALAVDRLFRHPLRQLQGHGTAVGVDQRDACFFDPVDLEITQPLSQVVAFAAHAFFLHLIARGEVAVFPLEERQTGVVGDEHAFEADIGRRQGRRGGLRRGRWNGFRDLRRGRRLVFLPLLAEQVARGDGVDIRPAQVGALHLFVFHCPRLRVDGAGIDARGMLWLDPDQGRQCGQGDACQRQKGVHDGELGLHDSPVERLNLN